MLAVPRLEFRLKAAPACPHNGPRKRRTPNRSRNRWARPSRNCAATQPSPEASRTVKASIEREG